MKPGRYVILIALLLSGCTKPAPPPAPHEIKVEIRGAPQAPQYYIANMAMTTAILTQIFAKAKEEDPECYVAVYTTLSDASTATRDFIRLSQGAGYKRIDIRLEEIPLPPKQKPYDGPMN